MPDNQSQLNMLRQELESLKAEFYKNNFMGGQDFNKFVRLNDRVKLPTLTSAPATCEIGEVYVNGTTGKAYVCSAANTWSLIGAQV